MLIDARHPEETRVVVVRGSRVEEFDFESAAKKQLRGNIYLAKVTRVEPSLQAAFVEYGGNRHGFLAFSEIHPDYYQIPVADRQRLLEMQEAEAREAEDEEDEAAEDEEWCVRVLARGEVGLDDGVCDAGELPDVPARQLDAADVRVLQPNLRDNVGIEVNTASGAGDCEKSVELYQARWDS